MKYKEERIVGIFMVILSLGMMMIPVGAFVRKGECTEPVQATVVEYVVDYESDGDGGLDQRHYARLSYTYNGEHHLAKGREYSRRSALQAKYPIGSSVTLYVNPQKPENYVNHLRSFGDGFGLVLCSLILMGSCCVGILLITTPQNAEKIMPSIFAQKKSAD